MNNVRPLLILMSVLIAVAILSSPYGSSAFADEGRWAKVRIHVPERETFHRLIRLGVDFEGSRGKPGGPMDCIVSADALRRLQDEGVATEILIPDLAAFYESRLTPGPVNATGFGYGSMGGYYTYDEVLQQLDTLHLLYPWLVGPRDSIGASLQGRPIWAVRMTSSARPAANPAVSSGRPQVLYFAMQHAREPIGMMVLLHTMWTLAEGFGVDPEASYLLMNRELWFIPVCNPDGYEANRRLRPNGGGMRRKNMRSVVTDGDARGVDLNRNWDSHWAYDDFGSNPDPLNEVYRGTAAFSEPESQVLGDFCKGKEFRFSMEYHSYWNTVFSPPGYNMSIETADSVLFRGYLRELTRLNHYSNGNSPSSYPVNGGANDWLYENPPSGRKHFPFLVEVGDDDDGFWPATSRILPLVSENLKANLFAAWAGGACPRVQQMIVDDSSRDGDLSSGEPFEVRVTLHNFGSEVATLTGVGVMSAGPYAEIPGAGMEIAGLGPHADTTISIGGRVTRDALEGVEERLVVVVSPDPAYPDLQFRDTVAVTLGRSEILFSDGAETGTTNWNAQLDWGRTQVAHTGDWSFTDSPNAGYRHPSLSGFTLASPITLPHTDRVVRLQFWARWDTEPGYDYAVVQASTDGGGSWSTLGGSYSSRFWRQEIYTGWEPRWIREEIDLSHLAGEELLLAFRFAADGSYNGDGFYVDDIEVRSYAATGSRLEPPKALNFGKIAVGEPDTLDLVLRNVGTSPLTVSSLSGAGDVFAIANAPPMPLTLPGTLDSLVVEIVFDPQSHGGPVTDTLVVTCDDPLNPVHLIPLEGIGIQLGVAAEGTLYAASGAPGSSLFTLDAQTGEATSIGPLETAELQTLCVRPSTGELYGTAQGGGALQLYRVSTAHGAVLPVAPIPLPGSRAMAFPPVDHPAFPPDQMYVATTTGKLYRVDVRSGDTTLVGVAPGVKFTAMTFDPRTGELWAADVSGTRDIILKVDPLTADTQYVGRTGDGRMTLALAFDPGGSLLALKSALPRSILMRVDASGAGTLVDTTGAAGIIAMAMIRPISSVPSSDPAGMPVSSALEQNYPNPFNPSTTIRYALPARSPVTLTVYNTLGQQVATLVEGEMEAGHHEVTFDASDLASGVYIYRLSAGDYVQAHKLVLVR